MATLNMTIDSSDDEGPKTKKVWAKANPKELEADIVIDNSEVKKAEYFLQDSGDDSDVGKEYAHKKEDGTKANIWSFNSQMKLDPITRDHAESGE